MNYIVMDLEWNQSAKGKQFSEDHFPFEIIQIGAAKVNEKLDIVDGSVPLSHRCIQSCRIQSRRY